MRFYYGHVALKLKKYVEPRTLLVETATSRRNIATNWGAHEAQHRPHPDESRRNPSPS